MEENEELKTAKQMYEYCRKNRYISANSKTWSIKHFSLIEENLTYNEYVILAFLGMHNHSGLHHDGNYAYAVTNKRIIIAQKQKIGKHIQFIYFNEINDVIFNDKKLLGTVTIDNTVETVNVCMDKKMAMKLCERLKILCAKLRVNNTNKRDDFHINNISKDNETTSEDLKTASRMYEHCVKNGYGYGWNRKWSEKHFSLIEDSLIKDEKVIFPFIGLYDFLAKRSDGHYACALTNKRLIIAQKKVFGEILQTIYVENINDITYRADPPFGIIIIDSIKETMNIGFAKNVARKVYNRLHEVLDSLKNSEANQIENLSINKLSEADEIMKFKELLDQGIITQEEFEKQKRKLLR